MKVAIIGGGAAGFFSAMAVKGNYPEAEVIIFEKSQKVLSKVKISGGGRCNVTNGCTDKTELSKAYPRGSRFIKQAFYTFSTEDTQKWFESRGVSLITQQDNCVFPTSQNSQSIIDVFMSEIKRLEITIEFGKGVKSIQQKENNIQLGFMSGIPILFNKVIVATGGTSRRENFLWIEKVGHKIEDPIPSLFTFNMPNESIIELMGIVVKNAIVSIQGTKLQAKGALLITHWGMSGPVILKLSAFGARILSEKDYQFTVQVNWVNETSFDDVLFALISIKSENPNKKIVTIKPFNIPERLWVFLLNKNDFSIDKKWNEIGRKGLNKLVHILTNDSYTTKGKTTFKEEFVTCGGISLKSINTKTMESKSINNLYFAGEVLDIDGITGGYNFQAAWTTGFIAGKLK